jgi:hypothetical protein
MKYLSEIGFEVVDWIHAAQDRDQLGSIVNTIMNFDFYKRRRIS